MLKTTMLVLIIFICLAIIIRYMLKRASQFFAPPSQEEAERRFEAKLKKE